MRKRTNRFENILLDRILTVLLGERICSLFVITTKMSVTVLTTVELTGLEKLFCLHGNWVIICHAAHLSGNPSIIVNNISKVIPILLKRHPRMRSRIQINGYQRLLEILDYDQGHFNPDVFYSIRQSNNQSWEQIAEEECHRNPYSNQGRTIYPLFYFVLLLNEHSQSSSEDLFHLLLFSNHSASDGRSGFVLMNDFLTLVTSSDLDRDIEPMNKEIIPCMNELIPRPYGLLNPVVSLIAKRIFKREARQLQHPRIPIKTIYLDDDGSNPHPLRPIRLRFISASTSTTLYSRLRAKCQSEHITLHGPLLACLFLAIDHCFPEKKKSNRYLHPWSVDMDYDMRSRLPQSPLTSSTVGYCVSICSAKLPKKLTVHSTRFWTLARKCVSITNEVLNNRMVQFFAHFFNDQIQNERRFNKIVRHFPNGCASEVNFSNVGKYPYSCHYGDGQLQLRGLHVINNSVIYHTSSVLLVTCAGDGQLDIALAHEINSDEQAQAFLKYYIHLIEKCADADLGITLEQLMSNE